MIGFIVTMIKKGIPPGATSKTVPYKAETDDTDISNRYNSKGLN